MSKYRVNFGSYNYDLPRIYRDYRENTFTVQTRTLTSIDTLKLYYIAYTLWISMGVDKAVIRSGYVELL